MASDAEINQDIEKIYERVMSGEFITEDSLKEMFPHHPRTTRGRRRTKFIERYGDLLIVDHANKTIKRKTSNPDTPILSDEETLVISTFRELISKQDSTFKKQAEWFFEKYKDNILKTIYAKADSEDISDHLKDLTLINQAITESIALSLNYDEKGERIIFPYRIAEFDGYWYIVALNKADNVVKNFYFKKMRNIQLSDERFIKEDEKLNSIKNAVNAFYDYHTETMHVELSVNGENSHILKRKKINDTQRTMREYPDGTLEISLTITNPMELIPFIQSWVPHVHVLSPDSLREEIATNLRTYLNQMDDFIGGESDK
jgi:predicted DNA-binding transcriptional regulator YafY